MVAIPLILKLKKERHKEIARAQDIIVREIYKIFDKAVLHGGTAIWRCYQGNRFSEDIDMYIPREMEKLESFFSNLVQLGFLVEKKKINENSIYSSLNLNGTIVRFEALFRKAEGSLKEYEKADGNFITVYTLLPEEIIKEKVDTYLKRLKIRDIYDIFFLLRYVQKKEEVRKELARLIKNFKKPADERELKALVFEGIAPGSEKMLSYFKRGL